jgi:murein endopeptidase
VRFLLILATLLLTTQLADADRNKRKKIAVHEGEKKRRTKKGPQSFGSPQNGWLENASKLPPIEGAHIRRPWRAFGTRTTVELTRRAIEETLDRHPDVHTLAIGDISAERGGQITDHHSHRSGRDVDLGLFYRKRPANYPRSFVDGDAHNLDIAATWTLISKLAATANKDGGVQVILLDHEVQGVIYRWAKKRKISNAKLERIFQYAHGRGASAGLVRHYRNHANHLHVRFKCARADRDCR